jgi:hypothetical protein
VWFLLSALAFVLTACWATAELVAPAHMQVVHTHGPLANPHAAWENDCAACHRQQDSSTFSVSSILRAGDRWHDLTCGKCHSGAVHNPSLTSNGREFHERCSNCHHDHAGRQASLVRLPDRSCTHCHANLTVNHFSGSPKCTPRITNFVTDHPEFRSLTAPPIRTLKFSHALHMTPGQSHRPGGKEAMTLGKLRALSGAAAERYGKPGQSGADPIQLDCASCHQLDSGAGTAAHDSLKEALAVSGEPSRAVLPARAAGANMLPINFEAHCRACHPLRAPEGISGGVVVSGFDLPHRRQLDDVLGELNAGYLRSMVKDNHPAQAIPIGPGGMTDPPLPAPFRVIRDEVSRLAKTALSQFTTGEGGCAKCHDLVDKAKIAPLPDRRVWFPAARFDHTSHRAVTCRTCHPGTAAGYAPSGSVLLEKEPVQILGIDSCRACHAPTGTRVTLPDTTTIVAGGIRSACTDCHRYHNNDHGLQGRGAARLFPDKQLEPTEFLRGKKD